MPARTRILDEVAVVFSPAGEETIRIVAPRDRAMLRAVALVLARGQLSPGDTLRVEAGDGGDDEH